MLRRQHLHTEGHNNLERWLLTYADMITLLTAFFLMLYSMSVMSRGKFMQVATSMRSGFGGNLQAGQNMLTAGRAKSGGSGLLPDRAYAQYQDAMAELRRFVEQHHMAGQVRLSGDERGMVISLISDGLLFDSGRATLRAGSVPLLGRVSNVLRSLPNDVQVEGHTDDLPIHTVQYPSNWELSTARAGAILRYFSDQAHLPGRRFTAAGYAETRPVVPDDSAVHRARNRRVEIVILKTRAQRQAELLREDEIRRITNQRPAPDGAVYDRTDPAATQTYDNGGSQIEVESSQAHVGIGQDGPTGSNIITDNHRADTSGSAGTALEP